MSDHHPGVVGGVIAREGLASLTVVVVFLSKYITDDIRRVATALHVDQQRRVPDHLPLLRGLTSARICLSGRFIVYVITVIRDVVII